ncbi:MAG: hypothetical protein ABEJ26_12625 [Halosimplex sp.]
MDRTEPLEEARLSLTEHIDAALEQAEDETAVFHLRQAKQLVVDLPTLVDVKADGPVNADESTE